MWGMFERFKPEDTVQIVLSRKGRPVGAIYKDAEREVVSQSLLEKDSNDEDDFESNL